jgi:protein-arginine kinase activator protein McsA
MEKKKCNKCEKEKEITNFSFKDKKNNRRSTICNECQKEYKNKWYHSNVENKENFRKTRLDTKKKIKIKMVEYLSGKYCTDCGEKNIITLDFDHKDGVEKKHNISHMVANAFSWESILSEISKCDIRCANCHRIRTAKQFGHYKLFGNI